MKFCTHFPYNAKLCLNGHEWLKRQLKHRGIGFEALDNGLLSCGDPKRAQALSNALSAAKIDALLRKWLRRLPHPYSRADRKAGYRYQISILQAEFSLTQVLDRPAAGRLFFEEIIREKPRYRSTKPGAADLWPTRERAHTGPFPHPGHHRGGADASVVAGGPMSSARTALNERILGKHYNSQRECVSR